MKAKKIIAIVLAVVAVAMVGFGIYTMNSSKYIFKKALAGVFDYAVDSYDEMTDEIEKMSKYEKYKISTDNVLTIDDEELVKIAGDMYVDSKANKSYLNLDSFVMEEEFFGLEGLVTKDKVYIKFKEALDKFFYTELDEMDFSMEELTAEGLTDEEFELLMNHLEKSILKDVSNKDLAKSSQKLTVDGKSYKTTKVTLGISEKRVVTIAENFLTSISGDKKAIKVLQKFDKSITKSTIDELLKEMKENKKDLSNDDLFDLSFYLKGSDFKRFEIYVEDKEAGANAESISLTYDIFNNKHKEKTYLLSVVYNKMPIATFKTEYTSETKANVLFDVMAMVQIKGTLEETDKKNAMDLKLIVEGETLGTLTYTDIVVKEDKEYKSDMTLEIDGSSFGDLYEEIPSSILFTSTNQMLIGENMPDVDTSDAVLMDDISEEDIAILEEYLSQKFELLGLPTDDGYGTDGFDWDEDEAYDTSYYEEISADEVEDLMNSEEATVLWYGSQDCTYCAEYAEALEEAYWDYFTDINYIDVAALTDSDRELLKGLDSRLDVTSTPTTVIFQNGEIKEVKTGVMTKDELYSFLDRNDVE